MPANAVERATFAFPVPSRLAATLPASQGYAKLVTDPNRLKPDRTASGSECRRAVPTRNSPGVAIFCATKWGRVMDDTLYEMGRRRQGSLSFQG